MNDMREKVIKGLECCAVKNIAPESARHCGICPYDRERNGEMDFDCQNDLLCDALEVMKTQEPKTVKKMLVVGGHLMGKCPRCCKILTVQDHPIACGFCGQAVKWDK